MGGSVAPRLRRVEPVRDRTVGLMADWVHETWRRIYRTPDPEWLALKASVRALAAELLRWVDDDGAIKLRPGEGPWQAIARVIQADRSDFAWVKNGVSELLRVRHLVAETERVFIRNFPVAQGIVETADERSLRRAKEAERKARQRAANKAKLEESRDNGSGVPSSAADMSRGTPPGTSTQECGTQSPPVAPDVAAGPSRAPTRAGVFPSVPLPGSRDTHTNARGVHSRRNAELVARVVVDDGIVPASPALTDAAERIAKKLDALDPEMVWEDLEAEVSEWIAHVRREAQTARDAGRPWSDERQLTELVAKAQQRIRWRPNDARKQRERRRQEDTRPRQSAETADDDDFLDSLPRGVRVGP